MFDGNLNQKRYSSINSIKGTATRSVYHQLTTFFTQNYTFFHNNVSTFELKCSVVFDLTFSTNQITN